MKNESEGQAAERWLHGAETQFSKLKTHFLLASQNNAIYKT